MKLKRSAGRVGSIELLGADPGRTGRQGRAAFLLWKLDVHDSQFGYVSFQGRADGDVGWVVEIGTKGLAVGQSDDDAMGHPSRPVCVVGSTLEIEDGRDATHEPAARGQMLLDALGGYAVVESKPGDMKGRHEVPPRMLSQSG